MPVSLQPLSREMLPDFQRWHNDFAIARMHSDVPGPYTTEQSLAWYEQDVLGDTGDAVGFAIHAAETGAAIGVTFLLDIDQRHGTCEYGITIGSAEFRGRGYGTEVTRLMLDHAFDVRGLCSVLLTVSEFNVAGIRAYAKCGFREIGRRSQCWWLAGRLWDRVYMECRRSDQSAPALHFPAVEGESCRA